MAVAKAKAKGKRRKEIQKSFSAKEQKAFERKINHAISDADERAEERYAYATTILQNNAPEVNEAVEKMVVTMRRMQPETLRFKVDGVYVNVNQEILERINRKLHVWVAVRLLVAAAMWDIRIAGFKLPKKKCARCLKKVK
jgi:hypothetical protein